MPCLPALLPIRQDLCVINLSLLVANYPAKSASEHATTFIHCLPIYITPAVFLVVSFHAIELDLDCTKLPAHTTDVAS